MAYKDPLDPRNREARRKHYEANKEQYKAANLRRKEAIKALIRQEKEKPCTDCGESYPHYVMDFDHLDPALKKCGVASMTGCGSLKKVREEIAKCEVVCANCHRIRTHRSVA